MLWKCCTQYVSKFGKLSSSHRTRKVSFHSSPKEGQCQIKFKLLHNCTHFTCWQDNTQKSFKLGFSSYVNWKLPTMQSEFRKGRGTRNQIANISWIIEQGKEFLNKKTSTSASLTTLKPCLCGSQQTVENFLKRWEYRSPYLSPEKSVFGSRSNS